MLLAEYLLISLRFDASVLRELGGVSGVFGYAGAVAPAAVVVAACLWMFRQEARGASSFGISIEQSDSVTPIRWRWFALHALSACAFFALTSHLFSAERDRPALALWLMGWIALGSLSAVTLVGSFVPLRTFGRRIWSAANGVALGVGAIAFLVGNYAIEMWTPLSHATLGLSAALLRPFYPDVSHPAPLVIGLRDFDVKIVAECSGLEGMGLISVLTTGVLVARRKRLHFPRALLLLPLAIGAAFFGNALRIAGLMVVGAELDPKLAFEAFHSKAGWVAFCAIGLSIAALAERHPYFRRDGESRARSDTDNPAAVYLLPFLLLLGTALITGMFVREVDWLYPARVIAPGLALCLLGANYAGLWRQRIPGRPLFALAVGALVGAAWYLTQPSNADVDRTIVSSLNDTPLAFSAWLAFRLIGAVVVVPLCEELAFRGFLQRFLVDRDFTEVSFSRYTPWAVLASSLAFAAVHERWVAGALAGLAYAVVQIRGGRLSDAIVAHASSNIVIAAAAIASGEWSRWV